MNQKVSERDVRIAKVQQLRTRGINPYVEKYPKTQTIEQVVAFAESKKTLRDSELIVPSPTIEVTTAGRVLLTRTHGALTFVRLQDQTGIIQVMLHKDNCTLRLETGETKKDIEDISAYKFFEKFDWCRRFCLSITGEVFRTLIKGSSRYLLQSLCFLTKDIVAIGR
jgi:lysyl-tRNA synthetase class II